MLTVEELERLRNRPLDSIDIKSIPDLQDIQINMSIPKEKRIEELLMKGINPYIVRVGDMKIKLRCSGTGRTLSDVIENMIENAED